MDVEKYNDLVMDFQNLMSCIQCHEDSSNVTVILETFKTIVDICTNEACGKDAFREEGGLEFLTNLLATTDSTILVEHLLKTLALVIDENVHCQMQMSKKEVFEVLQAIIRKQFPIPVLKNALLLASSILFQNSLAQNISFEIGFIQDLIKIFQDSAPSCTNSSVNDSSIEIWINVNSALCFAVNNPQNEKIQDVCTALFPLSLKLLESSRDYTVCNAVSSFLSLCIADNTKNQEKFSECDGLLVLRRCFQKHLDSVDLDMKEFQRVVTKGSLQSLNNLIGIISAVVSENDKNADVLGQLGVLSLMIKCLTADIVDVQLQTRIILALAYCIDAHPNCKSYVLQFSNFDTFLKKNFQLGDPELISASKYLLQVCLNNEGTYLNSDANSVQDNHSIIFSSVSERCYAVPKLSSAALKLSTDNHKEYANEFQKIKSLDKVSDIKQNPEAFSFLIPFNSMHPNDIKLQQMKEQRTQSLFNHIERSSQFSNLNLLTNSSLHDNKFVENNSSSNFKTDCRINISSDSHQFNHRKDSESNILKNISSSSIYSIQQCNRKNENYQEMSNILSPNKCNLENKSEDCESLHSYPSVNFKERFSLPVNEYKCSHNSKLKQDNCSGTTYTQKFNPDHFNFINTSFKVLHSNDINSDTSDSDTFLKSVKANSKSSKCKSHHKLTNFWKHKKFIFNNLNEKIKSNISDYSQELLPNDYKERMKYSFPLQSSKGLFNFSPSKNSRHLERDKIFCNKKQNKRKRNKRKKYKKSEKENKLRYAKINSKFNENTESLMQVIVFPGESCEHHKLISSFEMLKVISLE